MFFHDFRIGSLSGLYDGTFWRLYRSCWFFILPAIFIQQTELRTPPGNFFDYAGKYYRTADFPGASAAPETAGGSRGMIFIFFGLNIILDIGGQVRCPKHSEEAAQERPEPEKCPAGRLQPCWKSTLTGLSSILSGDIISGHPG